MNAMRVSGAGSGGAPTSTPSMFINQRSSLTHWCTICSWTLRPRGSSRRGRNSRSASWNSLHTLRTLMRSVAYVSTRKSYLMAGHLAGEIREESSRQRGVESTGTACGALSKTGKHKGCEGYGLQSGLNVAVDFGGAWEYLF